MADSFNASTVTIEDLLNRQRMLLANASHELRTPLARIRMGIELLDTRDSPERRAGLRQDIGELNALIDDLITMTRFDTGAVELSYETVDLFALATDEADRVEGSKVTGEHVEVSGDRRVLQHLIRNLMDNARKHGASPFEVSVCHTGNAVQLDVADQGPGVPTDEQHKVFEPFFRGADHQNTQGSGLGLSLVAQIAKAHGATLQILNSRQSTFRVVFPFL
ncbi:sensor histidine kinase KdpD [Ruegeria sp. Ofav3-42]|uniref:sensor histidine kinase n=1 Tax=Ruegeria sp. Ofav3-42 TaxID=2917759 RepID=UPI001EF674DD|nr:HAMP domain-containing sensor histidine kinase [Ruegeria sp. Ofav3-42]MCG7522574.1 HAMP domain-containing histidine kinase [Ruegeria sp. Ofav3-42]